MLQPQTYKAFSFTLTTFTTIRAMNTKLSMFLMLCISVSLSACTDAVKACFSVNDSACLDGQSCEITFDAGCSQNNGEFHWDFGDGTTGTGRTVAHAYSQAGEYLVSLAVDNELTGSNYKTDTAVELITVPDRAVRRNVFEIVMPGGAFDQDRGFSVVQTGDDGFIVAGRYLDFANGSTSQYAMHAYIVKTDRDGAVLWDKRFGDGDDDFAFYSVKETIDEGLIMAGGWNKDRSWDNHGYLVRTNHVGQVEWEVIYKPDVELDHSFNEVIQTIDGGYLAVGGAELFYGNTQDFGALLVKFDFAGRIEWEQIITRADMKFVGRAITPTRDGGYAIVGNHFSGTSQGILIKVDAEGQKEWDLILGTGRVSFESIIETKEGDLLMVGSLRSGNNFDGQQVYAVKTTATGGIIWEQTVGTPLQDIGDQVVEANNGGYIIAGATRIERENVSYGALQGYLLRLDQNGEKVWDRTYGNEVRSELHGVALTEDGGYVMTGYTTIEDERNEEIYLLKSDAQGRIEE